MNIKLQAAVALTVLALSACRQDTAPATDAETGTAPAADVVEPAIAGADGTAAEQVPSPAVDAVPADPAAAQAAVEAAADEAAKMVEEQSAEAAKQQ